MSTVSINTGLQVWLDTIGRSYDRQVFTVNASGTTTLITAPSGESRITVFAYEIQSHSTTVHAQLKDSGGRKLTPNWKFNDREGAVANSIIPLFRCDRGTNLVIVLDSSIEVEVALSYTITD